MELIFARVGSVLALLVLTLFFGTLPYCAVLRRRGNIVSQQRDTIIKYLNCFSGGVFLGSLFLHLMTEGAEEFDKYLEAVKYKSDYPFYNVVIIVGFFLTSSVEYFAHLVLAKEQTPPKKVTIPQSSSKKEESQVFLHSKSKDYGTVASGSNGIAHSEHLTQSAQNIWAEGEGEHQTSFGGNLCHSQESHHPSATTTCHTTFNIRSFLLLLALSFHSVFDGLALGLQETTSTVWQIFAAVVLHKCIIAFCLGLDIFMTFSDTKMAALMMVIFSLISPIGASVGISVTSSGIDTNAKLLSSGILQGLSCGAFLYVTFLEILNKYWKGSGCQKSFFDIICSFTGFTIMAILKIWS